MAQADTQHDGFLTERAFGSLCHLGYLRNRRPSLRVRLQFFNVFLRPLAANSFLGFLCHSATPSVLRSSFNICRAARKSRSKDFSLSSSFGSRQSSRLRSPPKPKRSAAQRRDIRHEMIGAHLQFLRVMREGDACLTEKLRLLASLGPLQMSQPRLEKIRVHSAHSCSVGSFFFGEVCYVEGRSYCTCSAAVSGAL